MLRIFRRKYSVPSWNEPNKSKFDAVSERFANDYPIRFRDTLRSLEADLQKSLTLSSEEALEKIKEELKQIEDGTFKLVDQSNTRFDRTSKRMVLPSRKLYKPQQATIEVCGNILCASKDLCENDAGRTTRHVFYTDTELYKTQERSNKAINQICCKIGLSRQNLNLYAGDCGSVIGPFTYKYYDELIDCNSEYRNPAPKNRKRSGRTVPHDLRYVSDMKNEDARFVLVVESASVFDELAGANFHNDYNCIIMTGKGMSDIAFRIFIKYIMVTFKIAVFLLSDSDMGGMQIYAVYKYGSSNMAFDSDNLANPLINWLGIWPSDIDALNIPSKKLSLEEERKVMQFWKKEFVTSDPKLETETCYMLERKKKASICSLDHYGLAGTSSYLVYKLYKAMEEKF